MLQLNEAILEEKEKEEVMEDYLENHADEFYQDIQSGKKHSANIMHPYIYLYEMMKIQYDAIIKYEQELEKMQ